MKHGVDCSCWVAWHLLSDTWLMAIYQNWLFTVCDRCRLIKSCFYIFQFVFQSCILLFLFPSAMLCFFWQIGMCKMLQVSEVENLSVWLSVLKAVWLIEKESQDCQWSLTYLSFIGNFNNSFISECCSFVSWVLYQIIFAVHCIASVCLQFRYGLKWRLQILTCLLSLRSVRSSERCGETSIQWKNSATMTSSTRKR